MLQPPYDEHDADGEQHRQEPNNGKKADQQTPHVRSARCAVVSFQAKSRIMRWRGWIGATR
jgi:hypothetical protein